MWSVFLLTVQLSNCGSHPIKVKNGSQHSLETEGEGIFEPQLDSKTEKKQRPSCLRRTAQFGSKSTLPLSNCGYFLNC